MSGYRKLISDRIPATWDVALRWCKCRQRYIERIYDLGVKPYNTDVMHSRKQKDDLKLEYVNRTLNAKRTKFIDTLELDRLLRPETVEEHDSWKKVADWVNWFTVKTPYIMNSISIDRGLGVPDEDITKSLMDKYKITEDLATYFLNL